MSGPVELSWVQLVLAACLMLVSGGLTVALGLGVGRRLLVASIRTVVQLWLLGWILAPVFKAAHPAVVGLICLAMVGLAARESTRRVGRSYTGLAWNAFFSLVVASSATVLIATTVVLRVENWWEPRYLIPLLGMVLGNGLNGISLGLERCLVSMDEGRARIELLLAAGAHPWEAAKPIASEAIRAGLLPILNSMSVVGLVTIPGMMTGQILGGTAPDLAARYQILVMFLIASATVLGTVGVVFLTVRALFDEQGRLRLDRLAG